MEKNLTKRLPTKSIIHYRHNLNIIKYNIRYNTTNTHETSFVHTENANTIQNQTWFAHCTILPFGVNLDGNTTLRQRFNRSLAGCIGELEGGWGLERWFGQSWFGCQMIHTHFSRPNIVQLYKRESDQILSREEKLSRNMILALDPLLRLELLVRFRETVFWCFVSVVRLCGKIKDGRPWN